MQKYYDGEKLYNDVWQAISSALEAHNVAPHSLLGMATILEAIASPLKAQKLNGLAGREFGKLGIDAYYASLIPRRIALLQSPRSQIVNEMMEGIYLALHRAKRSMSEDEIRLAAYRILAGNPRTSIKAAEKDNGSYQPAFGSALGYLREGKVVAQDVDGNWSLNELYKMA